MRSLILVLGFALLATSASAKDNISHDLGGDRKRSNTPEACRGLEFDYYALFSNAVAAPEDPVMQAYMYHANSGILAYGLAVRVNRAGYIALAGNNVWVVFNSRQQSMLFFDAQCRLLHTVANENILHMSDRF